MQKHACFSDVFERFHTLQGHYQEAHLPGAKIYGATYGDAWVWMAFAPVWHLGLAFVIGKRDQTKADLLLARVAYVTDTPPVSHGVTSAVVGTDGCGDGRIALTHGACQDIDKGTWHPASSVEESYT